MKQQLTKTLLVAAACIVLPLAVFAQTTSPQTISALTVVPSGTSAMITWTTSGLSNSQVAYGLSPAYTTYSTPNQTQTTVHSYTATNLQPGTTYHYQVISIDAGGNIASSSDATFMTTATQSNTASTTISTTSTTSTAPASYSYSGTSTVNTQTGVVTPVSSPTSTNTATPAVGTSPSTSVSVSIPTTPTTVTPVVLGTSTSLPPEVVNISPSGIALVRGTVVSTGANSITLQSWGGTWTVTLGSGAMILPSATNLSGIQAGDFVGAQGTIGSGSWTVNATIVHDWTQTGYTPTMSSTTSSSSSSTSASVPSSSTSSSTSAMPAGTVLYTGTVGSLGSNSFTLTNASGNSYTVNVDPINTTLWNNARTTISFSSIKSGDSIRLDGTLDSSSNTITPSVVRDTSI